MIFRKKKPAKRGTWVWLVERGEYSDRGVAGLFSDIEDAKKSVTTRRPCEWVQEAWEWEGKQWSQWCNSLGGDDLATITLTEIK